MIESNMVELDGFNMGQVEDRNGFEYYEVMFQYETEEEEEDEY